MGVQTQAMGHTIEFDENNRIWFYADTKSSLKSENRPCTYCHQFANQEDHDPLHKSSPKCEVRMLRSWDR